MHCDKLLFYVCLSKKKPYRAYVVMLLYSTVNKSSMSMSSRRTLESKKISNDQELMQSDPTSCPQNQKGNN